MQMIRQTYAAEKSSKPPAKRGYLRKLKNAHSQLRSSLSKRKKFPGCLRQPALALMSMR